MTTLSSTINKRQAILNKLNNIKYNQNLNAALKKQAKRENADVMERTVETVGDIVGNVLSGAIKGLEGIYDFGATLVGGIGGIFDKGFKDSVKKHISYDFAGKHIKEPLDYLFEDSYLNDGKVGGFVQNVAHGVGQMLPAVLVTVATGGAGASAFISPAMATMGASAMGNATESAFNDGASYGKGVAYGVVNGVVEMATEKMFSNSLTKNINSSGYLDKLTKNVAKTGIAKVGKEMAEEGIEEAVSEFVNPLTQTIYKGKDGLNNFLTKEHVKNIGESALVGGVTSLAFGETIGRINQNTNNANESLAELKALEIKEDNLHARGQLFQGGNEQKINNLRTQLKVELSQSVSKMNEKTRLEYITKNNLGSILNKDGSLIDNSLMSQQMNLKTTKDGLASTYNKESYSPKLYGKENELFIKPTNNDLTQSDKDALLRINKLNKGYNRVASVIVDSGMIKKVTGQNSKAIELNGVIYIEQGADTESSQKVLATHELNHTLEGTKEKAKFDNFIIKRLLESEVLSNRFGNINDKFIETLNLYKKVFIQKYGKLENVTQEDIEKIKREINQETLNEVISQYVSENFFTNEAVIDRLAVTEESLFQKIYNWIKRQIERFSIKNKQDREVYDFLNKAERLYKKALENSRGGATSIRYALDKEEEKSYYSNNELWGKLTKQDQALLYKSIDEIHHQGYWEYQLDNGDYLIDINNKVVISDGAFQKPSIEGVVEFSRNFPNKISDARDYFYEKITNGRTIQESIEFINDLYEEEVAIFYGKENSKYDSESRRQGINDYSNREVDSNRERTGISKSNRQSLIETEWGKGYSIDNVDVAEYNLISLSSDTNLNEFNILLNKVEDVVKNKITNKDEITRIRLNLFSSLQKQENRVYSKLIEINKALNKTRTDYVNNASLNIKQSFIQNLGYNGVYVKPSSKTSFNSVIFDLNNKKENLLDYSIERAKERLEKAIKLFGETLNPKKAGWLLSDGRFVDYNRDSVNILSENKERLLDYQDHYQIEKVYDSRRGTDAIDAFMAEGNIRLMPEAGGIEVRNKPNLKQVDKLLKYIQSVIDGNGITLDLRASGSTENILPNYIYYDKNTNARTIVNDINSFYNNGSVPKSINGVKFSIEKSLDSLPSKLKDGIINYIDKDIKNHLKAIRESIIANQQNIEKAKQKGLPQNIIENLEKHLEELNGEERRLSEGIWRTGRRFIDVSENSKWSIYNSYIGRIQAISQEFELNENKEAIEFLTEVIKDSNLYNKYNLKDILKNTDGLPESISILDNENLPVQLKEIKNENSELGIRSWFFIDEDGLFNANGFLVPDKQANRIFILLDSENSNFVQTNRHERTHYFQRHYKKEYSEFIKDINNVITQNEKYDLYDKYFNVYKDSYDVVSVDKFENKIWDEVYAQIYALNEKLKNQNGVYDAIEKFEKTIKRVTGLQKDIKFAIEKDSEVKDLVAIHNTTESKLLQTMELGGFPMPSIAIIKDEMSHENFGDISIIFKSDTINPQKSYDNKVYSADAYSPRFPQIAYSFNGKALRELAEKMNTSVSMLEANDFAEGKSRERIIESLKYNDNFIKHYVKEFNVKEEIAYKEPSYTNTCFKHEDINKIILKYSFDDIVNNAKAQADLLDAVGKAKSKQEKEFRKKLIQNSYENFMRKVEDAKQEKYIFDILKEEYDFDKKIAQGEVKKVEDTYQTRQNTIEKLKNDELFNEYVESIVDKVINKKYLRNNKDYYTSSGNPRSFEALHESYNAENAVRIMKEQGSKNSEGGNIFGYGIGEIRAALSKRFNNVEEMHKDKHRLQESNENSAELYEECNNELHAIADEISTKIKVDNFLERRDIALNAVFDIIASTYTNEQAKRLIKRDYSFEVNDSEILKIRKLAEKVADLPVKYFEAKPERVVDFKEVVKIFAPNNTNKSIIEFFKDKNIDIQLYGEKTPTRAELVKNLPQDIKFALSKGQVAKDRANNSKMKVYSKTDAEKLINEIIEEKLNIKDKFGTLKGRTKAQVINQMFIALNSVDEGYRGGVAQNIADYIIENAIYEDVFDNGIDEDVLYRYNTIKEYRGKLDLSSIKSEIHYKFDTKPGNAIMMQWGTTKGGFDVDIVAQELQELGIQIYSSNPADIFFEILDIYNDARDSLNKKSQKIRSDYFNEGELKTLKNELVREILKGYDKYGTKSKFSNLVKKYIDRIALLKETIKDLRDRNKAINNLFATIDKVNGLEKFKSADIELSNEVLGLIKLLKGVKTYRNNLSKNVREVMFKYSQEVDGKKLYDLVANNGDGIENPVAKMIEDIAHGNGELSTNEIKQLDDIMRNFIHNVKEYNRVFFEGKTQNDEEIVKQAIKETREAVALKTNGLLGSMSKFSRWLTAPVWRFERLSSYRQDGIMTKLFGELQQGVDNQARFNMIVAEHFNNFFKENKKLVSDWNKQEFDLNGTKLSRGQVITLYMLFQRKQAIGHLLSNDGITGTIRITNEKHASKGNFKDALAEGVDIQIDYSTLDKIKESLTNEEKEFIKLSKEFFDKISKNAKYETDMALYGISNVGEENYIPIRVADDQIYKQLGGNKISFSELFSVYNASFNKETKPNAKNKIVVENILDVINRHAKQMASYYGLAVPLKTLNRLYNKKLEDGSKLNIEINKVDPEFERYITKLLADLQGRGNPLTTFDKVVGKIRSLGAKASLGLNLKVLANQFVSLPASHAIGVEYKNIMKGFAQAASKKTDFDKLTQYCPMLYDRFREGSNIDVGLLKENQGVFGKIDALTELTTAPIGKIDKFICGAVWNACLEQTKSNKYEDYSDEHYKEAAKLTEKAVIKTQANYTALYRPAILREQNSFLQLSTMFMSEPLQQLSLIVSSIDKIYVAKQLIKQNNSPENQELLRQAKAEAKTAIATVMLDAILLALIAQAFKWVKGQDEEETILEGISGELVSNFIGMLPFIKDVYSIIEGYDVTNMAYTGLTNVVNGFKEMWNIVDLVVSGKQYSKSEIMGKVRKVLIGLSQTFGIPLRNLETYSKGIIEKFSPSLVYKWENKFNINSNNYMKDLQKAIDNNDDKLADTIINVMLEEKDVEITDKKVRETMKVLYGEGLNVFPRSIAKTIVYDGESIELTKRQHEKFAKTYSQANDKISSLVNSKDFELLSSEIKATSIKYIYDYYYEEALKDLLGIDSDEKKYLFAQAIDIVKLAMIVAKVSQVVSDKGRDGKIISGSRKTKIVSILNSMKLTATQKYMLMGYFGYKNTNGERQVKNYIQSLRLTKTEKETLFKMCGY